MIIRDFTLNGFGIFAEQHVGDVSQGVSVFLGDNEAGKSTCLKFFRHVLFGFPTQANKEFCPPLRGGNPGGCLLLDTASHGMVRLERRPGVRGGPVTLSSGTGEPLDAALLDVLLGGTTREVYESVYGFSLTELQNLSSLNGEKVRHALYGASFGTATRPVGQVLKKLDDAMAALYKSGGSIPLMNKKLTELDEVQRALRAGENTVVAYARVTAERDALEQQLQALLQARSARMVEKAALERRLSLWEQMRQLQSLRAQLAAVEPVVDEFPVDGLARLELLRDKLAACHADREKVRTKRVRIETAAEQLGMERHRALLARQTDIEGVYEDKGRYRTLTDAMRGEQGSLDDIRSRLQRLQEGLGPDWNDARVGAFDRSMFTQERIEQFAVAMRDAGAEWDKAREQHDGRVREREEATAALGQARAAAEALAAESPVADEALLDTLAQGREYAGRLLQDLPGRQQRHTAALRDADDDITALVPEWTRDHVRALDTSFTARESVAAAGRALREGERLVHGARLHCEGLEERLIVVEERLGAAHRRLESIPAHHSREELEIRRGTVRELRVALRESESARQACDAANEAYGIAANTRRRMLVASLLAVVCCVVGGGLLSAAGGGFGPAGMHLLAALGEANALTVGYVALVLGVVTGGIGLGAAVSLRGLDTRQHDDAHARYEATLRRIAPLVRTLLHSDDSGLAVADDLLDRAESSLDGFQASVYEREQLAAVVTQLEEERDRLRQQMQAAMQAREAEEGALEAARQKWERRAALLGLPGSTTPEVALSVFDRAEGIRARLQSLDAAQEELTAQRAELEKYCAQARMLPAPSAAGKDAGSEVVSDADLLARVDRALEARRQWQETAQNRARATQTMQERDARARRAGQAVKEAEQRMAAAQSTREAVAERWRTWLTEHGLAPTLSVETARRAVQDVGECVELLEAAAASERRIAGLRDELVAYEQRQDAVLADLQETAIAVLQCAPPQGRMAAADMLAKALGAAREAAVQYNALMAELPELAEQDAALATRIEGLQTECATLLCSGGVPEFLQQENMAEAEELFRTRGRAYGRRQSLLQELAPLEASLAADGASAGDVASDDPDGGNGVLDDAARARLEAGVLELAAALEQDTAQESALRQQISDTGATLKGLTSAEDAAELRAREAAVREDLHSLSRQWARHALARHLVLEAKRTFEQERQPTVIRHAGQFFGTMTGGAYTGLHASLEDDSIRAVLATGEVRTPEQLSRGTQEQLLLALRLGFITSHAAHTEPLPVIMDDILVNFDPGRAANAAEALGRLASTNQVLFFTCHPHMAQTVRRAVPDAALFTVRDGSISRSE